MPDARQDILKLPPIGQVVQDFGCRNEREREPGRDFPRGALSGDIVDPSMSGDNGVEAIPERLLENAEP